MAKTREPKPANTQAACRFRPEPCRVCQGMAAKKCMFCGQQWKMAKQDMTDWEIIIFDAHVDKMKYLRNLYDQLKAMKPMKLNKLPENDGVLQGLEDKILAWIGDWRN